MNICGSGFALEMLLTGEPVDAQRALTANLVSKVVAHDELLDAAEATVATILRNDQTALESAKETILDVIGRPLDDQVAVEAVYGYALMGQPRHPRAAEVFLRQVRRRTGRQAGHAADASLVPEVLR